MAAGAAKHDAFISYSRKNEAFASRLEQALESFTAPPGLRDSPRHLEIFRDKQDFTGNEYHRSLETHLQDSAKLIVVCSPEAAHSEYVNDEIRQFARLKGTEGILPVLISGIPNNEATPEQERQKAFPAALCEVIGMPLAADFRGFNPEKNKIDRVPYQDAWYTVLANVYGVPRAEIEQRDKKRQARSRRITAAVALVILSLIAAAAVVAWKSRTQTQVEAGRGRELRYIGNISLAQQAYNATDLPGMAELLKSEPNNLRGFEWRYLWRLSQGPNARVNAQVPVKAVAFSPDGRVFAAAGDNGMVQLWSAESLSKIGELGKQNATITGLAFSPDGKTLATAGRDIPVRLWDPNSRAQIAEIKELGNVAEALAFSPDSGNLAAIGFENMKKLVKVWDLTSHSLMAPIEGDATASGSGMFVRFSPDGKTLALSSSFGVRLAKFPSGETIGDIDSLEGYISTIAFSPNGQTLAAATESGKVLFFDASTRRKSGALDAHSEYVSDVAFSTDGKLLVTASSDKTIRLWDAKSHAPLSTLKGHAAPINALAISRDSRTVASASEDQTVRLWEVSGRPEYEQLSNLGILMSCIAASPVDNRLALASASTIVIWEPGTRKELARLDGHSESINAVSFSADGQTLAIASSGNDVELWDTSSRTTAKLLGHTALVYAVAFSPDGKLLASTSADHTIRLWGAATRQASPIKFPAQAKAVTAVAFSPDGKMLVTGSDDRMIKLWDVETGHQLASAPAFAETYKPPADYDETRQPSVTSVTFSPDGKVLATAGIDGMVALWRVVKDTLQRSATLTGHTGIVNKVVFSPDGRTIATASADTTVRLWNTALARELLTFKEPKDKRTDLPEFLRGTENQVNAVAFSRDGQFLVTGLNDGTVRLRRAALPGTR